MAIEQKIRSLHCGMLAGLSFKDLNGERVLYLHEAPYELENTICRWIFALPEELRSNGTPYSVLRMNDQNQIALTETGWSGFVSWMINELEEAQAQPDFKGKATAQMEEKLTP